MNLQLFAAYLLITFVLVIAPGPIVTLVVTTGATRGIRPALATVGGTTLGNALLLTAIALVSIDSPAPDAVLAKVEKLPGVKQAKGLKF